MNHRKPLALLGFGVLAAVALMALANALWFQVLTINADVKTAELKVGWQGFVCGDNQPGGSFTSVGWPRQTKTVAGFVPPQLDPTGTFFSDPAEITVTNAYPGYAVDCEVEFANLAQVPVHLERVVITVDDPTTPINPDYITECLDGTCKTFDNGPDLYDLNPATPPDPIYAELVGIPVGCQFHEGDSDGGSFKFGVRQTAKEHTTYVIKLKLQFNQWNESGFTGCNTPKNVPPTPVLPLDNGAPCDPILLDIPQQPCVNPAP
jgi:hypothetical protein